MNMLGFCNKEMIKLFGKDGQIDVCRFIAVNMAKLTLALKLCSEVSVLLDPRGQCGATIDHCITAFVPRVTKAQAKALNVPMAARWMFSVTTTAEKIEAEMLHYRAEQRILSLWEKIIHEVRHYVQHEVFHGDLRRLFKKRCIKGNRLIEERFHGHPGHLKDYRRVAREADAIYISILATGLIGMMWNGCDFDIAPIVRLLTMSATQGRHQVGKLLRAQNVVKAPLPTLEQLPISFVTRGACSVLVFEEQKRSDVVKEI